MVGVCASLMFISTRNEDSCASVTCRNMTCLCTALRCLKLSGDVSAPANGSFTSCDTKPETSLLQWCLPFETRQCYIPSQQARRAARTPHRAPCVPQVCGGPEAGARGGCGRSGRVDAWPVRGGAAAAAGARAPGLCRAAGGASPVPVGVCLSLGFALPQAVRARVVLCLGFWVCRITGDASSAPWLRSRAWSLPGHMQFEPSAPAVARFHARSANRTPCANRRGSLSVLLCAGVPQQSGSACHVFCAARQSTCFLMLTRPHTCHPCAQVGVNEISPGGKHAINRVPACCPGHEPGIGLRGHDGLRGRPV